MKALIIRIIKQIKNDKRTLMLFLFAPLLLLTLLFLLLGETNYKPKVMVSDIPNIILDKINNLEIDALNNKDIDKVLKEKDIDAVIFMKNNKLNIRFLNNNAMKNGKVMDALKDINDNNIEISYIYGSDKTSLFNSLGFVLLGVLSFFIVFLIAGISFIRERTSQTLERLCLTPIKRINIVLGYTFGFGFFTTIQGILIIIYSKYILGMDFSGSILLAITVMILIGMAAISLGMLVSIFANNEFQVVQFIPLIIVPQIFFSGLIPLEAIPYHLGNIAYIFPIYYGCSGLEGIMVEGSNLISILPYLTGLILFIIIFSFLNILVLKKYRKI